MSVPSEQPQADLESLPAGLIEDLGALYPAPRVPATVDARILNNARAAMLRTSHRRRRILRWTGAVGGAAAAAAAIVLVALHLQTVRPTVSPTLAGDIDGNGRIDILDAFAVARQIHANGDQPLPVTRTNAGIDLDRNGVIDQADVDALASLAVRVSPAGTRLSSAQAVPPKAGGGNIQ